MNEKQLELVYEALRLIQRRSVDPRRTIAQRTSYGSAYEILLYALNENEECLAQYDDVRLELSEEDFDGSFYFSEKDFME